MLAIQRFSTEQGREFGDKFGSDWDWSYSNDDQIVREYDIDSESECGLNSPYGDEPGKLPFARRNRNRSSQRLYRVHHTVRKNSLHK
jgi:hypothetical protein